MIDVFPIKFNGEGLWSFGYPETTTYTPSFGEDIHRASGQLHRTSWDQFQKTGWSEGKNSEGIFDLCSELFGNFYPDDPIW